MNVEESLYAELATHGGVAALVGTRIYPEELPQPATLPAITYSLSSTATEHTQRETASTIVIPDMQVQCWAETYSGAKALATQVKAALDGFVGQLGGAGGVNCWITMIDALDLGDEETSWRREIIQFEIWH